MFDKITINGKDYYDVKTFAALTDRSSQAIYRLISKGNSVRKLDAETILGKPLIPIGELANFPFCTSGPNARLNTYTFEEKAKELEARK